MTEEVAISRLLCCTQRRGKRLETNGQTMGRPDWGGRRLSIQQPNEEAEIIKAAAASWPGGWGGVPCFVSPQGRHSDWPSSLSPGGERPMTPDPVAKAH